MKEGIPYMGSKRKLAKTIVDKILEENTNTKYFYDLCGGGASISLEATKHKQLEVYYNDANSGVCELLKTIINNITPEFYQFVTKETFDKHKNDNSWFGGLLKTCWSFSNNQRDYIYGKNVMFDKELLHNIIVNKCNNSLITINNKYGINIPETIFNIEELNKRRLSIKSYVKVPHLERIQHLEQIHHLERIQHLEQIHHLELQNRLNITNQKYEDVTINTPINETVIYIDPPYKNTTEYQNKINHDELYEYIISSPYKIYISSYEYKLPEVISMNHTAINGKSTRDTRNVVEKLFKNR